MSPWRSIITSFSETPALRKAAAFQHALKVYCNQVFRSSLGQKPLIRKLQLSLSNGNFQVVHIVLCTCLPAKVKYTGLRGDRSCQASLQGSRY